MIYAARPGDPAFVNANMTLKLIKQIECCLKEKGRVLFPDDIQYFDPDQTCEVAPRITFKMAIGPAGFSYKEETELLVENKALAKELEKLKKVSQMKIVFKLAVDKIQQCSLDPIARSWK